jgi:hypothetical protein
MGHCDGYDIDMYLSELRRLLWDITLDHILVHDTQGVAVHQSIAIGCPDTRKIIDNYLLTTTEIAKQGKFDSIQRNTLKHDAKKVLSTIKNLL